MPAEPPPRRRRQSRVALGVHPSRASVSFLDFTDEVRPTRWESFELSLRRHKANFWPSIHSFIAGHPYLVRISNRISIFVTVAILVLLLFFRPTFEPRFKTLSPWHVELHNAWLRHHGIRESTWILDEEAEIHTSNDPSLVKDVLLQFPQRNGGSSIQLRDVRFDAKAHYGVISMPKLEQDHVPMRTLFGLGGGMRSIMGVEVIGRDVVAMAWGGGKGTYMLKAWTLKRCESGLFFFPFFSFLRPYNPYCKLLALWNWSRRSDIPAETMRELVDKHRVVSVEADEGEREESMPWRQRALDEESHFAQEEKKKKKGFLGF